MLPLQCCVVKASCLGVLGEDCLDPHLPKLNIGKDEKAQHLALILQRKFPERRTEARCCGSAAEKGSGKAVQRPLAPPRRIASGGHVRRR